MQGRPWLISLSHPSDLCAEDSKFASETGNSQCPMSIGLGEILDLSVDTNERKQWLMENCD